MQFLVIAEILAYSRCCRKEDRHVSAQVDMPSNRTAGTFRASHEGDRLMPAYNPSSGYQTFTPDPQNMSIRLFPVGDQFEEYRARLRAYAKKGVGGGN